MSEPVTSYLVAAEFNKRLVDVMIASAQQEMAELGIQCLHVIRVPGCYELPLTCGAALALPRVQLVVALGYIERGETQHGEVMGNVVHRALLELSLGHGKPIGLGIIGPGASAAQAELRKESYARAAVRAALASLRALEAVRKTS
jgi:6,7-dimethyl-8-ribityllumazine synthase